MDFSSISSDELQRIVLSLKTSEALTKMFNCTSSDLVREMAAAKVVYPVPFLRALGRADLGMLLASFSTQASAAEWLGVSPSTLTKHLKEMGMQVLPLPRRRTTVPELKFELRRLGSVALVSVCWGIPEAEVRKQAAAEEISVAAEQRLEMRGRFETGKGRMAELAFISRRGSLITSDETVESGSQALFDVTDRIFNRVNVKGSKMGKSGIHDMWRFSLSGASTCDTFAMMLFDSRWGRDRHCITLDSSLATSLGLTSITVHAFAMKGVPLKQKGLVYKAVTGVPGVDGQLVRG